jgi:hypothetical protein
LFSEIYIFEGNKKYDEHLGIYHFSKWNSQNIGQTCVEVGKVLRYSQNPRMAQH